MALQLIGQAALGSCFQTLLEELALILRSQNLCNFLGVGEELRRLDRKLSRIQVVLNDAEARILEKRVSIWMDDLRGLAYDMEEILDEMNAERLRLEQEATNEGGNDLVGSFLTFLDNVKESAQKVRFDTTVKRKINEVLSRVDEVARDADDLGLKEIRGTISMPNQTRQRPQTGPFVDESEVYGRENDKERIIELLLESSDSSKKKYSVIPIVGMGGIGKTTLAQLAFQDQRVENYFDLQSWACVSDIFDVSEVTKELIECASKENCSNMSLGALQCRLQDMVRDKRCFFVLDDVWTVKEWEKLQASFNRCMKGSKILVTTRNRKVANTISRMEPYELTNLEDKHCWALFKEKAFQELDTDIDENLARIGMEIVKKCKGIPLAVKVLGAILQGTAEEKWESILKNEFWQSMDGDDDEIFPALRISYHYLPPQLKRCFEYLSLFPTDYRFPKNELVRMWIAEGYVEAKEGRLLEDIGREYYNELQRRSLIQNDGKMHDLVHSLACVISQKFYYRVPNETKSGKHMGSIRHSSFLAMHIEIADLELLAQSRSLRTLFVLHYGSDALWDWLSNWSHLRVLVLRGTFILKLPSSIGDLKYLRHLNLSRSRRLQNLPHQICNLYNLQALNLYRCKSLNQLPEDIGNLQSLRFFNLCYTLVSTLPSSICNLSQLVTLDLHCCKSLANIPADIGYLLSLRKLDLGYTSLSGLPDSICKLKNLESLYIGHCSRLEHLPSDMGDLQNLKELNVDYIKVTSLPDSIVKITGLKTLVWYDGVNPVKLPPHLGKLINLETLEDYIVGKETGRGIEELKDMNHLRDILVISNLENVTNIEAALMANLKSKKHIKWLTFKWSPFLPENSDIGGPLSDVQEGKVEENVLEALEPHPSVLKYLCLENYCGNSLPKWMSVVMFSSLKHIALNNLQRISRMVDIQLPSLLELTINKCPKLREVSVAAPKLTNLNVLDCQELTKLSLLQSLHESHSNFLSRIDLPLLKRLQICNCTKLRNVSVAVPELTSLQVKGCTELNLNFPLDGAGVSALPQTGVALAGGGI